MGVPEIRVEELKLRLDRGDRLVLLDVRDEYEFEISNIGGQLIPLPQLSKRLNELNPDAEIVALCKHGLRSAKAVQYLRDEGFMQAVNLHGGIHAWSECIDSGVRKY